MKVKIGEKLYNSEIIPIMVILDDEEKGLISRMCNDNYKFCSYPNDGYTVEQIKEFMKIKE